MPTNFKLKTKARVGVSSEDVYVVPAGTTATVIGITLANTSGNSINVGVGVTRATDDDVMILKDVPIPQGSSLEVMQGNKIVLEQTDTITAKSDVAGSLDVAVNVLEITWYGTYQGYKRCNWTFWKLWCQ